MDNTRSQSFGFKLRIRSPYHVGGKQTRESFGIVLGFLSVWVVFFFWLEVVFWAVLFLGFFGFLVLFWFFFSNQDNDLPFPH